MFLHSAPKNSSGVAIRVIVPQQIGTKSRRIYRTMFIFSWVCTCALCSCLLPFSNVVFWLPLIFSLSCLHVVNLTPGKEEEEEEEEEEEPPIEGLTDAEEEEKQRLLNEVRGDESTQFHVG